jgi:hypothetical protein
MFIIRACGASLQPDATQVMVWFCPSSSNMVGTMTCTWFHWEHERSPKDIATLPALPIPIALPWCALAALRETTVVGCCEATAAPETSRAGALLASCAKCLQHSNDNGCPAPSAQIGTYRGSIITNARASCAMASLLPFYAGSGRVSKSTCCSFYTLLNVVFSCPTNTSS